MICPRALTLVASLIIQANIYIYVVAPEGIVRFVWCFVSTTNIFFSGILKAMLLESIKEVFQGMFVYCLQNIIYHI